MPAYQTIALPSLVMTSSSVDTSTQTIVAVDVSDAISINAFINATTTAPGFQFQVAFTSDSTATFIPLTQPTSGATLVYLTSAVVAIPVFSAKQARIGSSNVTSTSATVVWAKKVLV